MNIAIGADEAGLELKNLVREYLEKQGVEVSDFGVSAPEQADYPDVALSVAEKIADGSYERGILICGTGIGMAITANKVPGVRAAQAHDPYSAERARKSNDAQVLAMGARVVGPELAKSIVRAWLDSEFEGGGSAPKVARMKAIDEHFREQGEPADR